MSNKRPSRTAGGAARRDSRHGESGQAFIEFAFVILMTVIMLFATIDVGRTLYTREVLINLSREGANLASRGSSLTQTVESVMSDSSLNLTTNGLVIVTAITNGFDSNFYVAQQVTSTELSGTGTGLAEPSRVAPGGPGTTVTLPSGVAGLPPSNQALYVTEVFYHVAPITPIGSLIAMTLTNQYDAAFFVGLLQ